MQPHYAGQIGQRLLGSNAFGDLSVLSLNIRESTNRKSPDLDAKRPKLRNLTVWKSENT